MAVVVIVNTLLLAAKLLLNGLMVVMLEHAIDYIDGGIIAYCQGQS